MLRKGNRRARELLEQAVTAAHRTLGPGHRLTLDAVAKLAGRMAEDGQPEQARALLEQALAAIEGADPVPEVPLLVALLGDILTQRQELERAEPMLEYALAVSRDVNGPEHQWTLVIMATLAHHHATRGELDRAASLYEEVVMKSGQSLGYESPLGIDAMDRLGWTWQRQGALDKASQTLEEALRLSERVLGPSHPTTLGITKRLAATRLRQGKIGAAVTLATRKLGLPRAMRRNLG